MRRRRSGQADQVLTDPGRPGQDLAGHDGAGHDAAGPDLAGLDLAGSVGSPIAEVAQPSVIDPAAQATAAAEPTPVAQVAVTGPRRVTVPIGVAAAVIFVISGPRMLGRIRLPAVRLPAVRLASAGAALTWAVAGVTLFIVYLHVARTSAITSDGASNALQAWDMLHGNLLLRGWQVSDVSFYTTELPQYVLIERLAGLTPDVVHIASAMTYALLALLAALLAKGQATGREAVVRCVLAVGIMAAPQAGNAIFVLMGSPDHIGSTAPVLAAFLLLDRAPRKWYLPIAVGLVLSWALIADGIVLFTGIMPVVAVGLGRAYRALFLQRRSWRSSWFELALAGCALSAIAIASVALHAIALHGGFTIWPLDTMLASASDLPHYLMITGHGLLLLFGADFFSRSAGLVAGLAIAHLTGLGLAIWATCATIRRCGRAGLAAQLLATGIVCTLAAYLLSTRADDLLSTRDISAVLPFGAALAGRVLAGRLARARLLPALVVVLGAYLVSLGQVVTHPPAQPPAARLASWLAAHHLDYGLAGYWDANVATVQAGGRVRLRAVVANGRQLTTGYWETRAIWYDPAVNDANFIVLAPNPFGLRHYPNIGAIRYSFGQPSRIYYLGGYTIMVWNKNLLADLARGAPPAPRAAAASLRAGPAPGERVTVLPQAGR